jgi:hypothetical protein
MAKRILSTFGGWLTTSVGRPLLQPPRDRRPEIVHPAPDGLVADLEAALGQEFFDVPVAQREPQIQPNGLLDYRRRAYEIGFIP